MENQYSLQEGQEIPKILQDFDKVPQDVLDFIAMNCYRRALNFLSKEKDGIKTIYDEVIELSRKNNWGAYDELETGYKRKILISKEQMDDWNNYWNLRNK